MVEPKDKTANKMDVPSDLTNMSVDGTMDPSNLIGINSTTVDVSFNASSTPFDIRSDLGLSERPTSQMKNIRAVQGSGGKPEQSLAIEGQHPSYPKDVDQTIAEDEGEQSQTIIVSTSGIGSGEYLAAHSATDTSLSPSIHPTQKSRKVEGPQKILKELDSEPLPTSMAWNGLRMPFVVGGTVLRLSLAAQNKILADAFHLVSCEDEFEKVEQEPDFYRREYEQIGRHFGPEVGNGHCLTPRF